MQQRGKFVLFLTLMLVLVAVNILEFRRGNRGGVQETQARAAAAPVAFANAQDPSLRLDLLERVSKVQYTGTQRNIFQYRAATPTTPGTKVEVTPPPPPPPIPLRFFGFATAPGAAKKIFLANSEETFVVAEGDIVLKRYRVLRVGVNAVEIEDLEAKRTQTLPLEQP